MVNIRIFEDSDGQAETILHWLSQRKPRDSNLILMDNRNNWWEQLEELLYENVLEPEKRAASSTKMHLKNEVWLVDLNLDNACDTTNLLLTRYYKACRRKDGKLGDLDNSYQFENTFAKNLIPGFALLAYAKQAGIPARVISQGGNSSWDPFKALLSYLVVGKREALSADSWSFDKNPLTMKNHRLGVFPPEIKNTVNQIWAWAKNPNGLPQEHDNSSVKKMTMLFMGIFLTLLLLILGPLYFFPDLKNNGNYWTITLGIPALLFGVLGVTLTFKAKKQHKD